MKSLRYILIVLSLAGAVSIGAQHLARKPEFQMRSTSIMLGTGATTVPLAAATSGSRASAGVVKDPIRVGSVLKTEGNPFGDQTIGNSDISDPIQPGTPLGAPLWPLMILALVYAAWQGAKRRLTKEK